MTDMKEQVIQVLSNIHLPQKAAILKRFDQLRSGESMLVVNEYNPILLYYQLLADRGTTFAWEYLEKGQPSWRVKITKKEATVPEPTVGELAASDFRMAMAFQQLGISYCCEGSKTVVESCNEVGIPPQTLDAYIKHALQEAPERPYNFERWKAGLLAAYILHTYHSTIKQRMNSLYEQAIALAEQQVGKQKMFQELAYHLQHFFALLTDHIQREEQEVYPLIPTLEAARKRKRRMVVPINPPVKSRVKEMEQEHLLVGKELKQFKPILEAYRSQAQACTECTNFYMQLQEFENDLTLHIHLENNILFPKVVAVEQELEKRFS